VLDNLPHDKLRHDPDAGLLEAHVIPAAASSSPASGRPFREEFEPLADRVLLETSELLGLDSAEGVDELEVQLMPRTGPSWLRPLQRGLMQLSRAAPSVRRDVFVPTGCHLLLTRLCDAFPEHQLTLADFRYWSPEGQPRPSDGPPAVNAPVVQSQSETGGETRDWNGDYLAGPFGEADVMFATSFEALGKLYAHASGGRSGATVSTADFMQRHARLEATTTASGYNPLLKDFVNQAFFVTGEDGG